MKKRYYITVEVEADVDRSETVDEQRHDLFLFMENGMRREKNMKMFVQHSKTLSYIDEKGNEL
jgi:hypothetical protein